MNLVLPIVFFAVALGLCVSRMTPIVWSLMVICIALSISVFAIQH